MEAGRFLKKRGAFVFFYFRGKLYYKIFILLVEKELK
jgi:hypothetical protein